MALGDIQEVAHDSPDLGAPIKIGGIASSNVPDNVQEGDRVNASFDLAGRLRTVSSSTTDSVFPPAALLADDTAVPTTTLVGAVLMGYDGTNIDLARLDSNHALITNHGALSHQTDFDTTNGVVATAVKSLATNTYTPDLDTSSSAEASSVTKSSPGVLYGVTFSNGNASTRYLQFFNSTTVPADTAVPVITLMCPAGGTIAAEWPKGRYFSTGIVWCNSSTQNTKTIGSADSLADVNYK